MERKKKREKLVANGSIGDGTSGQSGDAHGWQREAEQVGAAKRLASSGTSDSPTQHSALPAFNWSFAQHPSVAQQQQAAHTSLPQPPHGQGGAPQQQAQVFQGLPQGGPQSLGGWQTPDAFAPNTNVAHPGVGEPTWSHPAAPSTQSLGGRPPPFPFPPPPYSGLWDPVAWWGHNPYQPPFPYLYPGYGGGYPCPMPPAPPVGAIQRGIIKPPPGLSQKHVRIWEAQSMENMQLWTTTTQLWAAVARSDAEIALQRTKVLKLESELQMMKAHRDGSIPQSDVAGAYQSGSKRGRRKKPLPAPLATTGSTPASDSCALSAPGRRARTVAIPYKVDTPPRTELEEKEKSTLTMPELVYRPSIEDHDQKSCTLTVNPLRNETASQKHSLRQTLEFQSPTNNPLNVVKDELPSFGHGNHLNSPFKPNNLLGGRKDCHFEQSLKESVAVSFLKTAGGLDHQGVIAGDMSYGASINSGSSCAESNGHLMVKDAIVRSQLQAHFNVHNMEKSVSHDLQKTRQYTGEDVSDEQDEGCASVQDDEDGDDVDEEEDENALDDMHSEKVSNLWHTMPFR